MKILQEIESGLGTEHDLFINVHDELLSRCHEMEAIFDDKPFKILSPCGTLYVYVECEENSRTCAEIFGDVNLTVTPGASIGSPDDRVRIAIGYERVRFDTIIEKLELL